MTDASLLVKDVQFAAAVNARAGALLEVARRIGEDAIDTDSAIDLLTRPALALIRSDAAQTEELLDAYGALMNARWRPFRGVIAAMKLFAGVQYSLVHLTRALPTYRLLSEEADLSEALLRARRFTVIVVQSASRRLTEIAPSLGLTPRAVDLQPEILPVGLLAQDGALWISWPKQSSGVDTDLTENVIRAVALAGGLVDVKVCAVDEVWSGLKLVRRLKDRR